MADARPNERAGSGGKGRGGSGRESGRLDSLAIAGTRSINVRPFLENAPPAARAAPIETAAPIKASTGFSENSSRTLLSTPVLEIDRSRDAGADPFVPTPPVASDRTPGFATGPAVRDATPVPADFVGAVGLAAIAVFDVDVDFAEGAGFAVPGFGVVPGFAVDASFVGEVFVAGFAVAGFFAAGFVAAGLVELDATGFEAGLPPVEEPGFAVGFELDDGVVFRAAVVAVAAGLAVDRRFAEADVRGFSADFCPPAALPFTAPV